MKTCSRCNESKPVTEYHADARRKSGLRADCKECTRAVNTRNYERRSTKEWRRARSDRIRERTYGVSAVRYEDMLTSQGGGCAICHMTPEENGKALAVDHDHSCCTGTVSCGACVRSLLCVRCNRGIGCFRDNADFLLAAAEYIERWTK